MKRIIRILVLAVTLVTGITTVSAQTVQAYLIPRIPSLPATVTNYLNNPIRYFNVRFDVTGAGSDGILVFFDMNFTANSTSYYVRTREGSLPLVPIRLHNGPNYMKSVDLETQLVNRLETNYDYSNPVAAQLLPEGTYEICVDFYLWSDKDNPGRESITIGPCPSFVICYSGAPPELVSPMAGAQNALNGANVLTPSKKVNFFWSPVISNCASRNSRFRYTLKVVKVLQGQNYQDAIKQNPPVFSAEVKDQAYAVLDTLRDVKVRMEKGALYVAQVHAERIESNNRAGEEPFIIANDGDSQPMLFFWEYGDEDSYDLDYVRRTRITTDDESEEGEKSEGVDGLTQWGSNAEDYSELETIIDELKEPYLAGFIQDASTIASLTAAYPEERKYVPTPERHYVESDGYYTVPMTDDLEVSFMPARHDKLKDVSYSIELYDYVEGGLDSITSYEPLFIETFDEIPDSYNKLDSHELISRTLKGWGAELEESYLYYLQLSTYFTVGYREYSVYDTVYYVNQQFAEQTTDTVFHNYIEDQLTMTNGVLFQWGDDPEVPLYTTPQWKAPVDRTGDDIYDPANYKLPTTIPTIKKAKSFPVSWTLVKDVAPGDEVDYAVNVYELLPNQTVEEAIADNDVLVSRNITDSDEISFGDEEFFKVFLPKKTYVMTLSTIVYSEENGYHFENGNEAIPIVFKIVK